MLHTRRPGADPLPASISEVRGVLAAVNGLGVSPQGVTIERDSGERRLQAAHELSQNVLSGGSWQLLPQTRHKTGDDTGDTAVVLRRGRCG